MKSLHETFLSNSSKHYLQSNEHVLTFAAYASRLASNTLTFVPSNVILKLSAMAKRTKTAARAGKVKTPAKPAPWKEIEPHAEAEADVDSDDGTFLDDDDTEDFLPTGWTGKTERRPGYEKSQEPNGPQNLSAPALTVSSSSTAITSIQADLQHAKSYTIPEVPASSPLSSQNAAFSIQSTTSECLNFSPRFKPTNVTCLESEHITIVANCDTPIVPAENFSNFSNIPEICKNTNSSTETVLVSRLKVPVTMVPKPKTPIETLQDEVKSLKHESEKKDRNLKTAKNKAKDAYAEAELLKSKNAEKLQRELQELRKELNAQHELRFLELRHERDEIEGQRQKATSDLRKLRELHERLKGEKKESQKNLHLEKGKLANLMRLSDTYRSERDKYCMIIGLEKAASNQAKSKIQDLERRLASERRSQTTLNTQLSQSNLENENLRIQLASRSSSQDTAARYNRLFNEHRRLKRDYDRVVEEQEDARDLEREVDELRALRVTSMKELSKVRSDLSNAKTRISNQSETITELTEEVSRLESDRDLLAPIVKIGVDIRLRYLEDARETALGIPRGDIDRAIIMNGNNAAHRANGVADAVLFKQELIPDDSLINATRLFEDLYCNPPSDYRCCTSRVNKLLDCRATIRTVKAVNNGTGSADHRDEHTEIDNELVKMYKDMGNDKFEQDEEAGELLERLEQLTDEIVEMDRSRYNRRRRYRRSVSYSIIYQIPSFHFLTTTQDNDYVEVEVEDEDGSDFSNMPQWDVA